MDWRWSECGDGCYLLFIPDAELGGMYGAGFVLDMGDGDWYCRAPHGIGHAPSREAAMALVERVVREGIG